MTDLRPRAVLAERGLTDSPNSPRVGLARGTLVMLRHGRTSWNDESRFTGWADPALSDRGAAEALRAGDAIAAVGLNVSVVITSPATRALETATIAMFRDEGPRVEWQIDWRLNERHFGLLQGLDRDSAIQRYGRASVRRWKRERDAVPPAIPEDDVRHPRHDVRYAGVAPELLPGAESIADQERRVHACWTEAIAPRLERGEDVLVVGHCHSLRALARLVDALHARETSSLFESTGSALMSSDAGGLVDLWTN